ncbi:MAG: sugar transferase [Anaerolineales bacterium]|nr:MAG: sugar transferase [Anaerolineales bacterium]
MGENKNKGGLSQTGRFSWPTPLRPAIYLAASLTLSLITWQWIPFTIGAISERATNKTTFLIVLALLTIHMILALTVERTLAGLASYIGRAWPYRLGFIFSMCLASIRVVSILLHGPSSLALIPMAAALQGAFLGGLLATGLDEGLWEDNSPPTEAIKRDVQQCHLKVIGKPTWNFTAKRMFDLGLSLLGLIVSAPIWMIISLLIWLEDPGPLVFIKNSVGMGGVNFHQFKFRTMVRDAEINTGPIMASEEDERVLLIGRLIRKTALDELPQLLNILRGDMSFVGPRPQRTIIVHAYLKEMPEFAERHRIRPGLSGLAQVAGSYYITPRQKLRYDRLYVRYASLGFDIKLIILAFLLVFWLRWRKDWSGRLPRRWLRFGIRLPLSTNDHHPTNPQDQTNNEGI